MFHSRCCEIAECFPSLVLVGDGSSRPAGVGRVRDDSAGPALDRPPRLGDEADRGGQPRHPVPLLVGDLRGRGGRRAVGGAASHQVQLADQLGRRARLHQVGDAVRLRLRALLARSGSK